MTGIRTYLDWNATTPPLDAVIDAMDVALRETWGNPASIHADGRAARARVEDARLAIAELASCDPRDVLFTSGGTEANNIAVRAAFDPAFGKASGEAPREAPGRRNEGSALITSRLEHPSITRVAEALEREGVARVRWLRVTKDGVIDLDDLADALEEPNLKLVALQSINHETGAIQPLARAVDLARAANVRIHVDAVQAFGRIDDRSNGADTRSLAAHKIRGPKGIGALVTRPGTHIAPITFGGAQERGLRPGTVDPVAAAGFAVAARHARSSPARYAAIAPLRDRLEAAILALAPNARVACRASRAPHITNIAFPGWNGAELVAALDLEGVSISSGSACSAGTIEPSPVIRAIFDEATAAASIRISMGEATTDRDVDASIGAFSRVLKR
jgi:cysteine desulfurase